MKVLLTVAALLAASQAQALSCIRPDPVTSFDHANTSVSPYMVMTGTLTAPPASGMTESKPVSLMAKLTGQGLAQDGFTAAFDGDVVLQVTCAGPWCGTLPASGPVVAFARIDGEIPVIEMDACGRWLFTAPDQATLDRLIACMEDGRCSAQPVQ